MNTIAIVDSRDPSDPNFGDLVFDVLNLTVKAMAPIVLVHGWNAGPWVWGPKPADGSCGTNPENTADGGQNLLGSLLSAKAPVDCEFHVALQSLIGDGAAALQQQLPGILASFGTRHAHLLTHSKGGLFARQFLQLNANQNPNLQIGVISVTTLDTAILPPRRRRAQLRYPGVCGRR